jgi:hypothetical protein
MGRLIIRLARLFVEESLLVTLQKLLQIFLSACLAWVFDPRKAMPKLLEVRAGSRNALAFLYILSWAEVSRTSPATAIPPGLIFGQSGARLDLRELHYRGV